MFEEYGYSPEAAAAAAGRVIEVACHLEGLLEVQADRGSRYLFGGAVSAADIYWACFSQLLGTLPDEINPMPYLRGSLGMPNSGPDSAGCQIFITHIPTPHLDGRYTVFGRVVEGMDVVDEMDQRESEFEKQLKVAKENVSAKYKDKIQEKEQNLREAKERISELEKSLEKMLER